MNKRNIIIVIVLIIIVGLIAFAIWFFNPPKGVSDPIGTGYNYSEAGKVCSGIDYGMTAQYKTLEECKKANNIK